jgi:L-ascorbate metabolism protein UlaG (beta-lactamase superfamily)
MRKITVLLAMLISIQICYASNKGNNGQEVEVTYIANEGFLVKVGDKKLLIDALFGNREFKWCEIPNKETMNSILKNEGDFKNTDLIVTTHAHIDHFYPSYVSEHLSNNMHGKFISCEQPVKVLKRLDDYDKINNQVVEITPDNLTSIDTTINDIEIRVYRLAHGPYYVDDSKTGEKVNQHQNVQNIGFLFNIEGIIIFHSGDSNEKAFAEYEHFRLDKEDIDIAFLNGGFMWKSGCQGIDVMKKHIKAEHIVMMHLLPEEHLEYNEIAAQLKNELPSIQIFENTMETKIYTIK